MKNLQIFYFVTVFFTTNCFYLKKNLPSSDKKPNVIFFHPDGMSLSHWDIGRIITLGPSGESSWDKMPNMAVYKSHAKDSLVPSSQAGATMHAYGEKVSIKSFGMKNKKKFKRPSLLKEAQLKSFKTGLVQSGFLMEPGTAVFASSSPNRSDHFKITEQLILSQTDLLLGGGEKYLLPKAVKGHFGEGARTDNKNLIEIAKKEGYHVIYTLKELQNIPSSAQKVLGIFAYENTYNAEEESLLKQKNLKAYEPLAPSIQEMSKYALEFLSRDKNKGFFLVVEEEGTDNFSNKNNAEGLFIAIKRSLKAIEIFRSFVKKNKNTLLIVASDSNASSPALISPPLNKTNFKNKTKAPFSDNGSPLDRKENGLPFLSQADKNNLPLPFEIAWPTKKDTGTGVIIKAEGYKAEQVKGLIDNTDVYKIMRNTLFY